MNDIIRYRNIVIHTYDDEIIKASFGKRYVKNGTKVKVKRLITQPLEDFLDGDYPSDELLDIFIFEYELKTGRKID